MSYGDDWESFNSRCLLLCVCPAEGLVGFTAHPIDLRANSPFSHTGATNRGKANLLRGGKYIARNGNPPKFESVAVIETRDHSYTSYALGVELFQSSLPLFLRREPHLCRNCARNTRPRYGGFGFSVSGIRYVGISGALYAVYNTYIHIYVRRRRKRRCLGA